mgnify:CR=1 FL=1
MKKKSGYMNYWFIFLIALIAIYFSYSFISVIGNYTAIKSIYKGSLDDKYLSYFQDKKTMMRFYDDYPNDVVYRKVKLIFLFTVNDIFRNGIIYSMYSISCYNEKGEVIAGSWNIPVTIFTRRNGIRWVIVDKKEAP